MLNSSSTAGPKLRDSCDACASSKLKCHKQKPTCSRCAKRGVACNYLATRRAGRRFDSQRPDRRRPASLSAPPEPQVDQLDLDLWFGTGSTTGSGDEYFLLQSAASSTCTTSNPSGGPNSAMLSPVNLSGMMTDLEDYLPSPTSMWIPDSSGTDMLGQLDAEFFSLPVGANNSERNEHNKKHSNISPEGEHNKKQTNETSSEARRSDSGISEALGCCLMQAMGLLQHIFLQTFTTSKNGCEKSRAEDSYATHLHNDDSHVPTMNTVITTNKQTIDAVGAMLQCSCSRNGHLLAIVSLIAFKVLDSYGAAGSMPRKRENHTLDDDSTYMDAQLILGELHRAQRLVNQLSAKMKEQKSMSTGGVLDKDLVTDAMCGERRGVEAFMPFSPVVLDQLEIDMRRRLKSLSQGLVAQLRRD